MPVASLDSRGFAVVANVLTGDECDALAQSVAALNEAAAGTRTLLTVPWCRQLLANIRRHPEMRRLIPDAHRAVQCTYFEKSLSRNWLVPVHQDLSIPVAGRVDHAELRAWSEKEGSLFVQPPVELLEQLVAVRVHLDACGETDGPLQLMPGSHRQGRISPDTASAMRRAGPVLTPVMARGDTLVMRPLLLHASSKATGTSARRVLHFLFGPAELPYGLSWENPS